LTIFVFINENNTAGSTAHLPCKQEMQTTLILPNFEKTQEINKDQKTQTIQQTILERAQVHETVETKIAKLHRRPRIHTSRLEK